MTMHNYNCIMFGAKSFIDYINRTIGTEEDSTYLGYSPTAHRV